jgi:hypothetical protein
VTNVQVAVGTWALSRQSAERPTGRIGRRTLVAGTNYIYARSVNQAGTNSLTNLLHASSTRCASPLTVQTNLAGAGAVTSTSGATNGASLIIGQNYTITGRGGEQLPLYQLDQRNQSGGPLTNHPGGANLTFHDVQQHGVAGQLRHQPVPGGGGKLQRTVLPGQRRVTEASSGFITVTVSGNSAGPTGKVLLDGGPIRSAAIHLT